MTQETVDGNEKANRDGEPRPAPLKKYHGQTLVWVVVFILIISVLGFALYMTGNPSSEKKLLLSTTTSTANSGLLDHIIPDFEKEYDCTVMVTPVGTGQALEMGRRGDVDILMVHAPASEEEFVNQGYGTQRYLVCYNYFVIIGPQDDPADLKSAPNASEAMRIIYEGEYKFASRGDDSGTHKKEKELWAAAGYSYAADIDIPDNDWYYSVSAGMGDTLIRANELEAYTLSDEGTYWAYEGDLDLDILLREDQNLLNQYSVIPVDPEKHSHVNYELSMEFVQWITSQEVQEGIGNFEKDGDKLFVPNAEIAP